MTHIKGTVRTTLDGEFITREVSTAIHPEGVVVEKYGTYEEFCDIETTKGDTYKWSLVEVDDLSPDHEIIMTYATRYATVKSVTMSAEHSALIKIIITLMFNE